MNANPAKQVALPKRVKKEMMSLTSEQAIAFLEAAKADRYAAMWFLAIDSGMRPEEYLALRWSDIKNGMVTIQRVLCLYSGSGGFYFDEPKTPQSRRSIPLSYATLTMLAQHKSKQNIERLKAGPRWQDENLIFTTNTGRPISLQNLHKRNFLPILKRAGIPLEYRIYDLRHTMATLLLEANENPKIVSERLGHASITLTLDNYSHVLPTMQERAKTALENQVFSKVAGYHKE